MKLDLLPCMTSEQLTQLRELGITSCRHLARVGQRPERLETLARDAELSPHFLRDMVHLAELSEIRGVGPAMLAHLLEVGVDSPARMGSLDPVTLQNRLRKVASPPPNLAVIESWISQARRRGRRRP